MTVKLRSERKRFLSHDIEGILQPMLLTIRLEIECRVIGLIHLKVLFSTTIKNIGSQMALKAVMTVWTTSQKSQ